MARRRIGAQVATGNRTRDFGVADDNAKPATAADLGLRRDEIHAARRLRDAERAGPGLISGTVAAMVTSVTGPGRGCNGRAAQQR